MPRRVLVFGAGELQGSLLQVCRSMGVGTVAIDPDPNAVASFLADHFEVVAADDFELTCRIVERYCIEGILTSATDKPLRMMAKVARRFGFPFISEQTARDSTDKYLMKQRFIKRGVPCVKGELVSSPKSVDRYPLICKPVDSSGSRGVVLCKNAEELQKAIEEALSYSRSKRVLVEDFCEGPEFSIEAIHANGKTYLVQVTSKLTTDYPRNVEIGHYAPANISPEEHKSLVQLLHDVASCMDFDNCASHTELKIRDGKPIVIETSPRLGGDFITSKLVPYSTGYSIERALVKICLGEEPDQIAGTPSYVGIFYHYWEPGSKWILRSIDDLGKVPEEVLEFNIKLSNNDIVPPIKTSLDRYGYFILRAESLEGMLQLKNSFQFRLNDYLTKPSNELA